METLRNEIIEAQKVRSDLLKWKLVIVAVVGATALGLSGGNVIVTASTGAQDPSTAPLALLVLPFACAYVDLLCRHLSLRISAIGLFFRYGTHDIPELRSYEEFYGKLNLSGGRSLESAALFGSTLVVCAAVPAIGLYLAEVPYTLHPGSLVFYGASLFGTIVSVGVHLWYTYLSKKAEAEAKRENVPPGPAVGGTPPQAGTSN